MNSTAEMQDGSRKRRVSASLSQVPCTGQGSRSPLSSRRRVAQHQDSDVFVAVLADAGCIVSGTDAPMLMRRDSHQVQQHLHHRLRVDSVLQAKFIAGLQAHVSDDENLRRMLVSIAGSGKGSVGICDSLARLLLSLELIQSDVASILLEKLPEHVGDIDMSGRLPGLMESTARLILSQFRWLDHLVDSRRLTEKLVEVVTICPMGLKKEIITFLPEIVVDQDHEMLMQALRQMLEEDMQLVTAVLDAFSNLNLNEDLFEQVIALALASLRSADVEDLPVVVRFLLQSGMGAHAKQVVQQLRNNLQFVTVADVRAAKPDRKQKGKSASADCEALVLDAIRTGLRFQNVICEAFLKEIKGISGDQNHKVVDIWILLTVHANGGAHRKAVEHLLLKKVNSKEIGHGLLRQCIQGRGESVKDYFRTILAVCELMTRSQELVARQFGIQTYVLLFEEFTNAYHRQEVLGSLITHTGSGMELEVSAGLDALVMLATKYPRELLPISSFINGILDYLECLEYAHLHQVYKIFSRLAVTAWSSGCSSGSSIADELVIIIRKQITNPEPMYQRMGVIGAVGLVASLEQSTSGEGAHLVSAATVEEALSIFQMILETCKTSTALRSFFYDELMSCIENGELHVTVMEWVSRHTCEFETVFLGDLEGGQIQGSYPECGALQGETWMNLDGEASPIMLNFLSLLCSDEQSGSIQGRSLLRLLFLPSSFRLLASVESVTNNGSLAGIDALLGCPLYLPKHELLVGDGWNMLSRRHKELSCLALYFAINWIKELMNVFSSQISVQVETLTQAMKDEIAGKLHKRLRNIIFLEFLLEDRMKSVAHLSFPELHSHQKNSTASAVGTKILHGNHGLKKAGLTKASRKVARKGKAGSQPQGTQKQVALKQLTSQGEILSGSHGQDSQSSAQVAQPLSTNNNASERGSGEPVAATDLFAAQRWKCRPLNMSSIGILYSFQDSKAACCPDPSAQLPVVLYLLRDLYNKLEIGLVRHQRRLAPWLIASACRKGPSGLGNLQDVEILERLQPLFASLRSQMDHAVGQILSGSRELGVVAACDHWHTESAAAGNPAYDSFNPANFDTAQAVLMVLLRCLNKILSYPRLTITENWPVLRDLLLAFSYDDGANEICADMTPSPCQGSFEYSLCSTFAYLNGISESATKTSFSTATEAVMVLKALVDCAYVCLETAGESRRRSTSARTPALLPCLRSRLSASAGGVLKHSWEEDEQGKSWKTRGDLLQQLLRMHIQNSEFPADLLEDLACNMMPQVASRGGRTGLNDYPTLSPATFLVWYRVQHEEVLEIFGKVVKEILAQTKDKSSITQDTTRKLLVRTQQCIMLHVALVNLTKTQNKIPVHAVAVKSGGKFVDTFLKVMDFLRAQYEAHNGVINTLVKELQKATRIVQTLCSEAKGQKKMPVTCKVPLVKRSMERYVFYVKALLHGTSNGSSFWMGNLRHKDLQGREVGSQLPNSDEEPENDNVMDDDENVEIDEADDPATQDEEPTF